MTEEKGEVELKTELAGLEAEFKEFDAKFGLEEEELEPEAFGAMTELEKEMELAGISEFGVGVDRKEVVEIRRKI